MMHYGHSNALRQARALGDELVVGLVSDSEIVKNKGSEPLMPFEERLAALTACKFVDEVIAGVDYELSEGWVNTLLSEHKVDFIAHGDDPCITADGKDAYDYPKRIGKFRMFKRTEGVSTTDLVGRMLLRTREHHIREGDRRYVRSIRSSSLHDSDPQASATLDLFHAGHAAALREARKHGDFVLVGVYDDETVHKLHGKVSGAPVMNLFERALSVLACRYVDDVVMGAPLQISNDLVRTFNVDKVVVGTVSESRRATKAPAEAAGGADPRALPQHLGKLHQFTSPLALSSSDIIDRVMAKRSMFESKVQRKRVAEDEYRETRGFVEEA
ncbi:hypothetical protein FNF28_01645 [Cafeteria roenbergensis]|uniref:ethanolamine-phosphate cytidylyltransferase n=1 Tax=Cafeteria roenbergensis TaxID=33653 RepID=A0A5A8DXH6_CAFRO|nr:hypothetical protein FNF28_01645 [Cafeteria roenbergensis]